VSEGRAERPLRWLYCLEECEWMAIWIGPHRHMLRDDGSMGIVVQRIPPADVPVICSRGIIPE
jgi:hypothetical protein